MKKLLLLVITTLIVTSLLAQEKPNVVFILADDLGMGDISYNNQDPAWFRHTPNIDEICEKGIYFKNYSAHHVCSPTRAGLLTGLHYTKVGSGSETGGTLFNNIPNVAKDFQTNGYVTGAFGKWHNGFPNFPIDGNGASVAKVSDIDSSNNIFEKKDNQDWGEGVNAYGFDRWKGYYSGGGDYFNRYVNAHHEYDWWIDQHYRPDVKGYTTDLIGEAAVNFIEDNKDNQFYCYVPMEAVHAPYQVKRSDLQELCSFFPGEWDYIKDIESPTTGRKISEVAKIRCQAGQEFDFTILDPEASHFIRLIYSTMAYSMDKAIGRIIDKLKEHDLQDNTIVFFSSDNGATMQGNNGVFQGYKHSLWEGGIHVPAAMWWPGNIDAESLDKYSPGDNVYEAYVQYIDYYPTIMSLTNCTISATSLDGIDFSEGLLNRVDSREEFESPYYGINTQWGVVKTGKWKLHYNEVPQVQILQLYDIENDPGETINLTNDEPQATEALKKLYNDWVDENNYAFSYLPVSMEKISEPDPKPEGDVLEVEAWQTDAIGDAFSVRFSNFSGGGSVAGDRIEFDIYVPDDSDQDSGFIFTPAGGPRPYYLNNNSVTQDTVFLLGKKWPRNTWIRNVVGYGNHAPIGGYANYISFFGTDSGYIHCYLDNIIVRHSNGVAQTIWKDDNDFDNIRYRYQDEQYTMLDDVKKIEGFPFKDVELSAASLSELPTMHIQNPIEDITLYDTKILSLDNVFGVTGVSYPNIVMIVEDWTNKDLLDVILNTETDEVLLSRKSNEGGESTVTITGYFDGTTLSTSFEVVMPQYTLELKDSIDDVSLVDSSLSINLDDVFEVTNKSDADIDIELEGWSNHELLGVTYDNLTNSLLLQRTGNEGGESVVDLAASWEDSTTTTSFNVEIVPLLYSSPNLSGEVKFQIYPNPSSGRFFIETDEDEFAVNIYNLLGEKILSVQNIKRINISEFDPGLYFVEIRHKSYFLIKKLQVNKL